MYERPPNDQQNYQTFADRKILKDLPFYRRYPRTFVAVGSTLGFLILFSKALYDIFTPTSFEDVQKKLFLEKIKQSQLQHEIELRKLNIPENHGRSE